MFLMSNVSGGWDVAERGAFNAPGFYAALDGRRAEQGVSWRQVAGQAGVSQSTLTRLAQGKRPDVDSLAKLANWSQLSVDGFITRSNAVVDKEPLAAISTYLRADRSLTADAAAALDAVIRATYDALKNR